MLIFFLLLLKYKSNMSVFLQADRLALAVLQAEGRVQVPFAILQAGG